MAHTPQQGDTKDMFPTSVWRRRLTTPRFYLGVLFFAVWLMAILMTVYKERGKEALTLIDGHYINAIGIRKKVGTDEQNLAGICAETGTNLLQQLGREGFLRLINQQSIETLRLKMLAHTTKHWAICEREECGLYYIPISVDSLASFFEIFKKRYMNTATLLQEYPEYGLGNYPFTVLKKMGIEKLNLKEPIPYEEGLFLQRGYFFSDILFFDNKTSENLLTFDELAEQTANSFDHPNALASMKKRSRYAWGNFYIKRREISIWENKTYLYDRGPFERLVKLGDLYSGAISNCGDEEYPWDFLDEFSKEYQQKTYPMEEL